MKKIFIIILVLTKFLWTDFSRDNSSEIVTDNVTLLQWQDNSDTNTTTKKWEDALNYCLALTLGSYDDWRLPNIKELLSIADKNKASAPAINNVFQHIAYTPSNLTLYTVLYWSSTTSLDFNDRATTVNFNYGDEMNFFANTVKINDHHIRCVRNGQ